ncbi:MAG: hypothetical protein RIS35_3028 [Pseudomonadota bacterium]
MNRGSQNILYDAVIVGRGAVGVASALGLSRLGLRVALVAPAVQAEGAQEGWDARVFAISPASRDLLRRLRVWDAIDHQRVAPVYDMRIWPDTRVDAPELRFGAYESCVDALAWIIEGRNLGAALERGLAFAGVDLIDGSVAGIDVSDPARTRLSLAQGCSVDARLLIAADGARSPTRALLGIPVEEYEYPQGAIVANFETARPHRDCAYQWFGSHGILAVLPLPGNRCSIVWSAPKERIPGLLEITHEAFSREVAELASGMLGALSVITPPQRFPLRMIRVERVIAPRAVLVGDAAHAVHPLSGQGMNLGFGDVGALLETFERREPFRDLGDRLLLRRYERARREPVATMRATTDGLQRLFDPDSALGLPPALRPLADLREVGWRLVQHSPWLKRRLIAHAAS